MQLSDDNGGELARWCGGTLRGGPEGGSRGGSILLQNSLGTVTVDPGDYIIQGVTGEFFLCRPDQVNKGVR